MRFWTGRRGLGLAAIVLAAGLATTEGRAQVDCAIEGPTVAEVNQPFTLCGPGRGGYTYEWHGAGLASPRSSCVTVNGRPAGEYRYELITYLDGVERDRCWHTVRVGAGAIGSMQCTITGPRSIRSGTSATLCAPSQSSVHSYEWSGPTGVLGEERCVTVSRAGDYELTIRNRLTGYTRQCTHRLAVTGTGGDDDPDNTCGIEGPQWIDEGGTVRLCAGSFGGTYTFRWTAPNGAMSTSRCITGTLPGTYYVTMRDQRTGAVRQCSYVVRSDNWDGDPESPMSVNCPRPLNFWRQQCTRGNSQAARRQQFPAATLTDIARRIDQRSRFFNWTNDVDGLCTTLSPAAPLTYRKHLARHFVALLANVAASETNLAAGVRAVASGRGTVEIGLDADTRVSFRSARTVHELINLIDNMLMSRTGDFEAAARYLMDVNRGVGIGPTCE